MLERHGSIEQGNGLHRGAIGANLGPVASAVAEQVSRVIESMERIPRLFAIECGFRIVDNSPIDTGHFLVNWQAGVGNIPSSEIHTAMSKSKYQIHHKSKTGGNKDTSSHMRFEREAVKRRIQSTFWKAKAGDLLRIQNNVKYASALEAPQAHSKQAPGGVVTPVLLDAENILNSIIAGEIGYLSQSRGVRRDTMQGSK